MLKGTRERTFQAASALCKAGVRLEEAGIIALLVLQVTSEFDACQHRLKVQRAALASRELRPWWRILHVQSLA